MRILSGIQPSGQLHLGNYLGMMRRMISYQEHHDLYCFIVNYHALTSQHDGAELKRQTLEAAVDFLALGLNPARCVFWVQSDLPEVTELSWILSNWTSMGLLERCHSYKDKTAQGLKPHHALFAYPVLMTADILIMQADRVPVGQDQKQHLEVAQDIAERFNFHYGPVFKVPEPDIDGAAALVPGIDGRKMSKSYGNTLPLFAAPEEIKRLVMSVKTDSTPVDAPKPTRGNVLYEIYASLLSSLEERQALENRFTTPGLRYSEIKKELIDRVAGLFEPYREKRKDLLARPDDLREIMKQGALRARRTAEETMGRVRDAVGLKWI